MFAFLKLYGILFADRDGVLKVEQIMPFQPKGNHVGRLDPEEAGRLIKEYFSEVSDDELFEQLSESDPEFPQFWLEYWPTQERDAAEQRKKK